MSARATKQQLADAQQRMRTASRAHSEAVAFTVHLGEPAKSGVVRALELVPEHRVPVVRASSDSPWIHVDQIPGPEFVVLRTTGDVYEVGEDGAVGEEPVA